MKIAMVCPRNVPFVVGGAERLWDGLVEAINVFTPHTAVIVAVPSPESSFAEIVQSYANFAALDLSEYDLVISGKYPAWMVQHPLHVVYMCHPLRGLYDTYDQSIAKIAAPDSLLGKELVNALSDQMPGGPGARHRVMSIAAELVATSAVIDRDLQFPGPLVRDLVQWLDADALHPSRISRYLAISRTVAERPGYFPARAEVVVVVPPSGLRGLHEGSFEAFFSASRLDHPKRMDLLVAAMAHLPASATLRIAGSGPTEAALLAAANGDPRIQFLGRISDRQLVEEYASALAVPFVPYDEDLGLITIEAQMSAKPVITCSDSGGTADLVEHGVDGLVVSPDPVDIAAAMHSMIADPAGAQQMGRRGRRRAEQYTWTSVVDAILAAPSRLIMTTTQSGTRRKIVVLNTYSAFPARHGGQIRINRLYTALAERHDVHLIAIVDDLSTSCEVAPGFRQTIVSQAPDYHRLREQLTEESGVAAGDVAAALAGRVSDEFKRLVDNALCNADAVILPHPYLFPIVRDLDPAVPVIYDSQNAEWKLKSEMYGLTEVGRALANAVAEIERALLRRACLVIAVSYNDIAELRQLTPTMADFAVVPNGGDFSTVTFVTGAERTARRQHYLSALERGGLAFRADDLVVFLGSAHQPNIDAARIMLQVAEQMPDILFMLIGSHVQGLKAVPVGRNVIARGSVDAQELQLVLSLATAAVNPMAAGSGTNIKMLDYLAAGVPTIATAIGARGLPAEHRRDLLIAENCELVRAIREVIENPTHAVVRARAGRTIAEPFDWSVTGQTFTDIVTGVIGTIPPSVPLSL